LHSSTHSLPDKIEEFYVGDKVDVQAPDSIDLNNGKVPSFGKFENREYYWIATVAALPNASTVIVRYSHHEEEEHVWSQY
jgi:hypothetical protein